MFFSSVKQRQRQQLLAEPFPEEWLRLLTENLFLYHLLPEVEQGMLQNALRILIAEKNWEGCGGLQITDEIRVTIAAQASLLILGFDDYYFDEVKSILVYPGGYLSEDSLGRNDRIQHLLGEAHRGGPVILSWWHAQWDGRRYGRSNLVLHEFAHQLELANDFGHNAPPLDASDLEQRRDQVMGAEYDRLVEDASYGRPTLLDYYGAVNRIEFFAVATECFFQQPVALRRRHASLYQILAEWYRQDPVERWLLDGVTAGDAARAEDDYYRHAIAECSAAITRHPDQVDAYRRRAAFYGKQGEYDKAIADYGAAIRLVPDDAEVYCDRGDAYLAKGCPDEALSDFAEAIRLCPRYSRAYCERGAAYAEKGDQDRAIADLNRAIRIDPKDDTSYHRRGLLYLDRGKHDRAIRDFSKAIRLCPYWATGYSDRAAAYLGNGEYDRAIDDCGQALDLEPWLPEPHKHRGVAYYHKGEYGKAIADCSAAIRLDPEYVEAYRARALAHAASGEEEKAQQDRAQADKLISTDRETMTFS